jgi:NADP-dependent 3-hydroxy acid dehydrogenase YdfG
MSTPTAVVIGAGPGLGMSIAHRFGREGYRIALVSRSDARHAGYLASLAGTGITAEAFVADVRERDRIAATLDLIAERFGAIDVVYYGPGAADLSARPKSILEAGAADVAEGMNWVYPAVDVVGRVLPGMLRRGTGGLLFAGGLSAVVPMPALGGLAVASAALRNYALTLHAGLAEKGIFAGNLAIGGLIERGDIHRMMTAQLGRSTSIGSLDPDDIAEAAWQLYTQRESAEATFVAA